MSNVDINVDRRTDGLTDGRTENRTPISHPATSRCDNKRDMRTSSYPRATLLKRNQWGYDESLCPSVRRAIFSKNIGRYLTNLLHDPHMVRVCESNIIFHFFTLPSVTSDGVKCHLTCNECVKICALACHRMRDFIFSFFLSFYLFFLPASLAQSDSRPTDD